MIVILMSGTRYEGVGEIEYKEGQYWLKFKDEKRRYESIPMNSIYMVIG